MANTIQVLKRLFRRFVDFVLITLDDLNKKEFNMATKMVAFDLSANQCVFYVTSKALFQMVRSL